MNWFDRIILRKTEGFPVPAPGPAKREYVDESMNFTADIKVWEQGVQNWAYKVTVKSPEGHSKTFDFSKQAFPIRTPLYGSNQREFHYTEGSASTAAERKAKELAKALRVEIAPKVLFYTKQV